MFIPNLEGAGWYLSSFPMCSYHVYITVINPPATCLDVTVVCAASSCLCVLIRYTAGE